jgi:hypothetical protein
MEAHVGAFMMPASAASPYTNDPALAPFLAPEFSPIAYLNSSLPPLLISSSSTPFKPAGKALNLPDLAAHTQSHLTQLSAQNSRLSAILTTLTDDILRSGSRLAYEVEVLRGEALSLSESLSTTAAPDLAKFLRPKPAQVLGQVGSDITTTATSGTLEVPSAENLPFANEGLGQADPDTPPSIPSLRTLHHVRAQLQSVILTFNAALLFPFPPSLLSSPLLGISAPSANSPSIEAAGQASLAAFRDEISSLLAMGGPEGVVAAEERVEELRKLAGVWKGTAEEKARLKFVDSLSKVVQDKRKEEENKGTFGIQGQNEENGGNVPRKTATKSGGSAGFLRRLRDEMYLD